ncbi:MAG: DNA repair protein RecO [Treponema sp. CETP13]|nr:MAG: DNA repair protein RecO [Treponema sp. CETP13]
MERNITNTVIVLSLRAVGESSRLATCISPERGVFTAMVFGGRKGKLKSLVSPYHSGKMWLYVDSSKNSIKVQDFDVLETRPSIRENIYKTCAAALGAELVIKTGGVSEPETMFYLIKGFLDGLNLVNENSAKTGTLRFLWRYLEFMGLQPDCFFCSTCRTPFSKNSVRLYSATENGFICNDCIAEFPSGFNFPIGDEAIHYLQKVTSLPPNQSRATALSQNSYNELHQLLFFLISQAAESKLHSLEAGRDIL